MKEEWCQCGHGPNYHPTIASGLRQSCGKATCNCVRWRPVVIETVHYEREELEESISG